MRSNRSAPNRIVVELAALVAFLLAALAAAGAAAAAEPQITVTLIRWPYT